MSKFGQFSEIVTRAFCIAFLIVLGGSITYGLYSAYTLNILMGAIYTLPAIGFMFTLGLLTHEFIRQIKLVARGEEVPKNPSLLQPPAFF